MFSDDLRCSGCGSDISTEPAIRGIEGIYCFPCRYKMDEDGGEEYLIVKRSYEQAISEWNIKFKPSWDTYNKLTNYAKHISLISYIIFVPILLFIGGISRLALTSLIVAVPLALISIIAARRLNVRAWKFKTPRPPVLSKPSRASLYSELKLVFDGELDESENSEFVYFKKGYPPDWGERKERCLQRDARRCRICGDDKRLHVHHAIPVSYGGNHSIQNLVTLCQFCHMNINYFGHRDLVRENIRAKRKYYVQPFTRKNGTLVRGHSRRIDRRGNFWKRVRNRLTTNILCVS